jgi:hypothetical protein
MISEKVGLNEEGKNVLEHKVPEEPVTCVIIGAGQRGRLYASYAEDYPAEWKVVGVAGLGSARTLRHFGLPLRFFWHTSDQVPVWRFQCLESRTHAETR